MAQALCNFWLQAGKSFSYGFFFDLAGYQKSSGLERCKELRCIFPLCPPVGHIRFRTTSNWGWHVGISTGSTYMLNMRIKDAKRLPHAKSTSSYCQGWYLPISSGENRVKSAVTPRTSKKSACIDSSWPWPAVAQSPLTFKEWTETEKTVRPACWSKHGQRPNHLATDMVSLETCHGEQGNMKQQLNDASNMSTSKKYIICTGVPTVLHMNFQDRNCRLSPSGFESNSEMCRKFRP